MNQRTLVNSHKNLAVRLCALALLLAVGLIYFMRAYGVELPQRSMMLGNNEVSVQTAYTFAFTIPVPETLGSIKIQFCSEDPLVGQPCTGPAGMDASGVVLSSQSGETGFSISTPNSNANTIVITRPAAMTTNASVSYTFQNLINPSAEGTYYARVQTFASTDASGSENEHGGIAFSINGPVQVSSNVPPYLLFCSGITISGFDCSTASGDYVSFGNLTSTATASATTQMLTATNAANGFTIRVYGTTMTSGNNTINAMTSADVSRPGISQFGLNLVANATPAVGQDPVGSGAATVDSGYNQADWFKFVSGDVLASALTADEYKQFTASYILNIPTGQPVGVYATTLTYVCLANF